MDDAKSYRRSAVKHNHIDIVPVLGEFLEISLIPFAKMINDWSAPTTVKKIQINDVPTRS